MSIYRVIRASIYRSTGLVTVEPEEYDSHIGLTYHVVGHPEKQFRFRASRPIYEKNVKESTKSTMIIDPPSFPIEDLNGQRITNKPLDPHETVSVR